MIRTVAFVFALALLGLNTPAQALEEYPQGLSDQFVSWCTGAQEQSESVCSCALRKSMTEIPATALSGFLSAAGDGALTAAATGIGAQVLNTVLSCAGGTGGSMGTTGSMLNSLGSSFGK